MDDRCRACQAFYNGYPEYSFSNGDVGPCSRASYATTNKVAGGDVSAVIGITGDMNGTFAISFSKASAIRVGKNMPGNDMENLLVDVQNAVGEIAHEGAETQDRQFTLYLFDLSVPA